MARHYPELADGSPGAAAAGKAPELYLALLHAIVARQASLIARWQLVGFIHGVMNTDNMALSGETIDYGPCAFMDAYDPATVFSSIDHGGRYAYGNQPAIAQWNLARLAEAMLPVFAERREGVPGDRADIDRAVAQATDVLDRFPGLFQQHWLDGMRAKLGLFTSEDDDESLVEQLLAWMRQRSADFTNTFRLLSCGESVRDGSSSTAAGPTEGDSELAAWRCRWDARRARQPQSRVESEALMRRHNPAVIPRNHNVEAALTAAAAGDLSVMQQLLEVLATPYDHERDLPMFSAPGSSAQPYRTFCGT
jgi:uncharacterized protein YdiU (UPF0061 family)